MASPNSVSLKSWLKLFFFQMCKLHTTPLTQMRSAGADRGLVSPTAGRQCLAVTRACAWKSETPLGQTSSSLRKKGLDEDWARFCRPD